MKRKTAEVLHEIRTEQADTEQPEVDGGQTYVPGQPIGDALDAAACHAGDSPSRETTTQHLPLASDPQFAHHFSEERPLLNPQYRLEQLRESGANQEGMPYHTDGQVYSAGAYLA